MSNFEIEKIFSFRNSQTKQHPLLKCDKPNIWNKVSLTSWIWNDAKIIYILKVSLVHCIAIIVILKYKNYNRCKNVCKLSVLKKIWKFLFNEFSMMRLKKKTIRFMKKNFNCKKLVYFKMSVSHSAWLSQLFL